VKALRFTARALLALIWVCFGLLVLVSLFPLLSRTRRLLIKQWWSGVLLRLCGIEVTHSGLPIESGPVLWVINHVSWLDIFALNQVRAAVFIAKSEIRRWPLLGWLVAGADTIFIERASRHAVQKVGQAMQDKFERGQAVGLFPEGTTSNGYDLLPFYANLFEPARRARVPIQPVALLFFHHGRRSDFAAFVGEENLIQNLWRVLGGTGIQIKIEFLPPIWQPETESAASIEVTSSSASPQDWQSSAVPTRAQLGKQAHEVIRQVVLKR
jgi:1-acyl-sn-glycerol-3-phosphate acyltransferase